MNTHKSRKNNILQGFVVAHFFKKVPFPMPMLSPEFFAKKDGFVPKKSLANLSTFGRKEVKVISLLKL